MLRRPKVSLRLSLVRRRLGVDYLVRRTVRLGLFYAPPVWAWIILCAARLGLDYLVRRLDYFITPSWITSFGIMICWPVWPDVSKVRR